MRGIENRLYVRKIENGTVIDHIPSGYALDVLKILGLTGKEGHVIAIVMNVESKKFGKKDIVKIEDVELDMETVNKIALLAPHATINIIRNYSVVSKNRVKVPMVIKGIVKCINPRCITNKSNEPITSIFETISTEPLKICCHYCGITMGWNDILRVLVGE